MHDALEARRLDQFRMTSAVTTRWSDNDMYGHLNNAVYYELFDTAINSWLAQHASDGFERSVVIGVVAESACRFHADLSFPGVVTVGFRISRLGRSSVTYELGCFEGVDPAADAMASASGRWVHVYVGRDSKRPTPVPAPLRAVMASLT